MSEETEDLTPKATKGNEDVINTPLDFLISFLTQLKNSSDNVPNDLRSLINQSLQLVSGMLTYPLTMSSGISQDAQLLANKTRTMDFQALYDQGKTGKTKYFKEMSSDILQAQILKMLVRMSGAKRVLEIGTFTGFAALNMAEALPSDGHLVTMEFLPFFVQFARDFLSQTAHGSKIEVREGCALNLLKGIGEKGKSFDFIFVDAKKDDYKEYFKIILDHNILSPKGTMLFDNTLMNAAIFVEDFPNAFFAKQATIMHEFNQTVQNETRVVQVMLPVRDGVTVLRRVDE